MLKHAVPGSELIRGPQPNTSVSAASPITGSLIHPETILFPPTLMHGSISWKSNVSISFAARRRQSMKETSGGRHSRYYTRVVISHTGKYHL